LIDLYVLLWIQSEFTGGNNTLSQFTVCGLPE